MNYKANRLIVQYYMIKTLIDIVKPDGIIDAIECLQKIKRLAIQHKLQCENACNGYGYIPRKGWYTTNSSHAEYKDNNAYITPDYTVNNRYINLELI